LGSRGGSAAPTRLRQDKMVTNMRPVMLTFPMVTTSNSGV
jgi:hypothetical protein